MVLVTGGAGYIGSHTLIELFQVGYDCVVYDNLSNGSIESLKKVKKIVGKDINFVKGDIRDKQQLQKVFKEYSIDSVIHFAGLKVVGESIREPLKYYKNNVNGTLVLLEVMEEFDCKKIVFSSSASIYGDTKELPIKENSICTEIANPYGRTKYFIEEILKDKVSSKKDFYVAILRYFNPIGAHSSGLLGEDSKIEGNNLMPYILKVAKKEQEYLEIFGGDYDTKDGTGVRDYIHVMDLANAHIKALEFIDTNPPKPLIVNIGTGKGYSVLDIVECFKKISKIDIPYKIVKRREGDIAKSFADPSYAKEVLGWEATKDLATMCEDTWRWQMNNPDGYN